MSASIFVDTNILVYAYDLAAGTKHDRARRVLEELWNSNTGVISTQVLQEFSVNVRRKARQPISFQETAAIVQTYLCWPIVTLSAESVIQALEIEARHKVSFWDALIIHAAETAGATTLYSEDFSSGQTYGSITVVNPLLGT